MELKGYTDIYLQKNTSAAVLAVFRIALGMLLFISILRFWSNGWIADLYITPQYFFPFYGFEFVKPLGAYTYLLFGLCALSALMVALGWYYRVAMVSLFLSFTYIELIDKSTYLNHYYFISLICLLMVFLPAQVYFSVDAYRNKSRHCDLIPQWCVDVIKLMVAILYVYAGIAKINSEWLLHALPLKIWLPARNDMPVIGFLFNKSWVHYAFSWIGCIYDLSIPFLLLSRKTRVLGYVAVVVFHVLTSLLFPIGMFPYIMIVTALIFFPASFHEKILSVLQKMLRLPKLVGAGVKTLVYSATSLQYFKYGFIVFFALQLLMPFRYLLYPGDLFWTEEGFRFSWRVMLMEKAGYAQFTVKDSSGKKAFVNNTLFLTKLQEKMMATQPDMILQYAHILRDHYASRGFQNPEVYVDAYVALNGHMGRTMIDPTVNLAKEKESFNHKSWIVLYND